MFKEYLEKENRMIFPYQEYRFLYSSIQILSLFFKSFQTDP